MKCKVCGQPIRVIPSNSKFKDTYNKIVLIIGHVCMKCALAYKQVEQEADNLTWEKRAEITKKRMMDRGMNNKEINETIKKVDEMENKK